MSRSAHKRETRGFNGSSFFDKFLLLMICGCILTAALTAIMYVFTGGSVFAQRIADELLPRAHSIARLATRFQTGQVSYDSFIDFTIMGQDATRVYVFDESANLVAYTTGSSAHKRNDRPPLSASPSGDDTAVTETMLAFGMQVILSGEAKVSTDWLSNDGIIVGVPVEDNMQRVCGAIVLSRSSDELYTAMFSLMRALVLSCLAASALMIIPTYVASRRMSNPVRSMMRASIAMAGGDFSIRADENREDEIGLLGASLNHLSEQLRDKISDLVLARNRLHMILDGLSEGVVATSMEGQFVYHNQAAMSLFGVDDDQALMRALEASDSMRREVMQDRVPRSMMLDAGERRLSLTASFSQESNETAYSTIIVVQDVTSSERLEQTRRDYVANVSHELRTPIASIRSVAETLNDGLIQSEEDRSRYYGYILRESLRLSRLINDLLELSRIQSGSVALEKHVFVLDDVIEEVAERMRIVAEYSDIRIETAMHADAKMLVNSNRDRIEQALIALVDNAIKFAEDDGVIVIDASADKARGCAIVSVRNTGHIAQSDLPHLFERFYKADASHTEGGTGLGLAIVSEILTRLGETIDAYNENGCAVFRFTIALGSAQTQAQSLQ